MIREFSAGVVPFRKVRGRRKYLILKSGLTRSDLWEFPKGHIEKGEDSQTAALREFLEETGLEVRVLVPGFRKVMKYFYRRGKDLVSKSVTYYLGEVTSGEVTLSHESTDSRWVTAGEAQLYVRHKNVLDLLGEAEEFLSKERPS